MSATQMLQLNDIKSQHSIEISTCITIYLQ